MHALPRVVAACAAVVLVGCSSGGGSAQPTPSAAPATSAAATSAPTSASPSPDAVLSDPTYLALGDSVAAGVGAQDPARDGYVPVLARLLTERLDCGAGAAAGCPVRARDLAVPGATTATLLSDQLPVALDLLAGDADVRLVTVTIGGNDVFVPILQACARTPAAASCTDAVRAAIAAVDTGVDRLLDELAGAVAPGTRVAVMTYYDPLPGCRLASLQPLAEQVLEGTAGDDGLNDVLRARAAEHGALVVETGGRLRVPEDLVGGLDCLHPSTSGHARIAEAFADAVAG